MINIKSIIQTQIDLLVLSKNEAHIVKTIDIGAMFFNEKYFKQDIRVSEEHSIVFQELKSIKSPVLYWFTFDDAICSSKNIRNCYESFRIKPSERNSSSYKPRYDDGSVTLYVGKVKTGFYGRLITHLGYNTSVQTAGLQLYHWFDIIKFSNLTLNYIVFDKDMSNMVTVLEMEYAQALKPLIGKY